MYRHNTPTPHFFRKHVVATRKKWGAHWGNAALENRT